MVAASKIQKLESLSACPAPRELVGVAAELHEALQRLDCLLSSAVDAFDASQGSASQEKFRGLYIAPEQVSQLLSRQPGQPPFVIDRASGLALWPATEGSFARRMADSYGLAGFDLDVLLIALAPEYDLRYERLYAYLQDDVTRKRPTVDLILALLCPSGIERLQHRPVFSADAPLVRQGIVHLVADPQQTDPPLLARYIKPDEQIVRHLLGDSGLDSRLAPFARSPVGAASLADLHVADETRTRLTRVAEVMAEGRLHVWLHGPAGIGKRQAAAAVARHAGYSLLTIDVTGIDADEIGPTVSLAMRQAWLQGAVLCLGGIHGWLDSPIATGAVAARLTESPCHVIFASNREMPAALRQHVAGVHLPLPDAGLRARCWQSALVELGRKVDEHGLAMLANLFRLTPVQIEAAAVEAVRQARLHPKQRDGIGALPFASVDDCIAAARGQSAGRLDGLAGKIDSRATWSDIVLPDDALAQLHELCQRVEHRGKVLDEWGFAERSVRGRGSSVLFAGPSGTGKTMAAEVIANDLGLDLYCIDLAGVVSKYIGETEKNLDRIFSAAECANAILFFDEADALFGKRSEVKDSHDRYANLEISYLLQKMERYEGITILATNLRQSLDEAFMRRLAFIVHFPFPDEAQRRRIWSGVWPAGVPLAEDIDPGVLAGQLKFSGGHIRNVALAAAFLAAGDGQPVGQAHVLRAAQRELQKIGKSLTPGEQPSRATA